MEDVRRKENKTETAERRSQVPTIASAAVALPAPAFQLHTLPVNLATSISLWTNAASLRRKSHSHRQDRQLLAVSCLRRSNSKAKQSAYSRSLLCAHMVLARLCSVAWELRLKPFSASSQESIRVQS